jgi:hypothetical protein
MITASIIISAAAIFAAIVGSFIHYKSKAYRAYRRDEAALNDLALGRGLHARKAQQRVPTRLRSAAIARRKVAHACGHNVSSLN